VWSRRFCKHFLFHIHVDFNVDMCGVDVGVPQPVADHINIVTGPQQMHGRGMTERVRADGLCVKRRALTLSRYCIFAGDVANAKAGYRCAVGVKEQLFD